MKIGSYQTLSEIGRGRLGTVYRAHGVDGALVALKLLHGLAPDVGARFDRSRSPSDLEGARAKIAQLEEKNRREPRAGRASSLSNA
ncbi:hypothetical protein HY251_11500 [bacterium]|nr:hypothetical protein [bacterium]